MAYKALLLLALYENGTGQELRSPPKQDKAKQQLLEMKEFCQYFAY